VHIAEDANFDADAEQQGRNTEQIVKRCNNLNFEHSIWIDFHN